MNSVKYSIIIPVYNVADYLRSCLDSVLACMDGWDSKDVEIICVDDCSTDGSRQILIEYEAGHPSIKILFLTENGGVSAARNAALDCAKGKWIMFIDADDVVAPYTLSVVEKGVATEPSADLLVFRASSFGEMAQPNWTSGEHVKWKTVESEISFDDTNCPSFSVWGKVFRRSSIDDIRFASYCVSEDYLFMIRVSTRIRRFVTTDVPCYGYRQRMTSVMHNGQTVKKVLDVMHANCEVLRVMSRAGKHYSRRLRRLTASQLFEETAIKAHRLGKDVETAVLHELIVLACEFWSNRVICVDLRLRLLCCRVFPFAPVARVMFFLGAKFKKLIRRVVC